MPKQKQKSDRALYSDKTRSFNQSECALYRNFIIIQHKTVFVSWCQRLQKYHLSKKYRYQDCVFLVIGISVYLSTYYVFNTTKKHAEHFVILSANQVYQLSLNLFFLCSIRLSKMDIYSCINTQLI